MYIQIHRLGDVLKATFFTMIVRTKEEKEDKAGKGLQKEKLKMEHLE